MIAVFASKAEFVSLVHNCPKAGFKHVTDNIERDFHELSIDDVLFLGDFHKYYPNLERTYTEVLQYIRGPRCQSAKNIIRELIKVEKELSESRETRLSAFLTKINHEYR